MKPETQKVIAAITDLSETIENLQREVKQKDEENSILRRALADYREADLSIIVKKHHKNPDKKPVFRIFTACSTGSDNPEGYVRDAQGTVDIMMSRIGGFIGKMYEGK